MESLRFHRSLNFKQCKFTFIFAILDSETTSCLLQTIEKETQYISFPYLGKAEE